MNSLARVNRELQAHQREIADLWRLTQAAAEQSNDAFIEVTRDAIRTLEQINAELITSAIPRDQRAMLRKQVEEAIGQHERLLAKATAQSHAALDRYGNRPVRRQSAWDEFAESVEDTLHTMTGNLFRGRNR